MKHNSKEPAKKPANTKNIPVVDEAVLNAEDLKILDIPILTEVVVDKAKTPAKPATATAKETPDAEQ